MRRNTRTRTSANTPIDLSYDVKTKTEPRFNNNSTMQNGIRDNDYSYSSEVEFERITSDQVEQNTSIKVDAINEIDDYDNIQSDNEHRRDGSSSSGDDGNSSTTDSFYSQNDNDDDSSNSKNNAQHCEYELIREYASAETRRVLQWRWIILLSIMTSGITLAVCTYYFLQAKYTSECKQSYELIASSIESSFHDQMNRFVESQHSMSLFITSNAVRSNRFPFVSVPAFEVHAHAARTEAGIEALVYAPIVAIGEYEQWIRFTNKTKEWLEESRAVFDVLNPGSNRSNEAIRTDIPPVLYGFDVEGQKIPWNETGATSNSKTEFCPRMYTSPPPLSLKNDDILQNEDMLTISEHKSLHDTAFDFRGMAFSPFNPNSSGVERFWSSITQNHNGDVDSKLPLDSLYSISAYPVFGNLNSNSSTKAVGLIFSWTNWEKCLRKIVPANTDGILLVLRNSYNQAYTFNIEQGQLEYHGPGDLHDSHFDDLQQTIKFEENYFNGNLKCVEGDNCNVFLDIYPSSYISVQCTSGLPVTLAAVISTVFLVMGVVFLVYDRFVQSRNDKLVSAAARSNAIVSSLFPSNVRDRLLAEKVEEEDNARLRNDHSRSTLKGFLAGDTVQDIEMQDEDVYKSKPIADLFPDTTVMFGDIVGFTAWSSVREPSQVFTLLETIYHAFDEIARKRRVFKVETVGDCYVAVCGLPDPRKDHAVNMCRFAKDCMRKMLTLVKKLEVVLGPDTGDLSMRIGLHSGPVTAGVLRGERSRFQLFGDTMNTAARMESNGKKSCIQLSQETADLLIAAGKTSWVTARDDKIIAKGKGEMQTYWLELNDRVETGSVASGEDGDQSISDNTEHVAAVILEKTGIDPGKTERLIDWNVEVLLRLLRLVVARRSSEGNRITGFPGVEDLMLKPARGQTVLDEVKEIITLPQVDSSVSSLKLTMDAPELSPKVAEQLHDYVWNIASMYRNNPFHNFEHASHVTMSVVKLLSRIVAPSENDFKDRVDEKSSLHDHTYGITSDPLTQFSCVLSALIHDLDHPGVPNAQLVKENSQIASVYKNKSVAEQNSVDIAWHLLMDERYDDLRCTIYTDEVEMKRFRQLVVNSVMATDIVDKELKNLRNARWEKAFSDTKLNEDVQVTINRKATIVIEHLIQASDVAHTMQHWHIYRKWNERFFMECYKAYKDGRADTDPSINWYTGEIGFFDFYIIPLAKKLKNCGVFGVSSDEYLNYAIANRKEWEQRGQDIVAEMVEMVNSIWG